MVESRHRGGPIMLCARSRLWPTIIIALLTGCETAQETTTVLSDETDGRVMSDMRPLELDSGAPQDATLDDMMRHPDADSSTQMDAAIPEEDTPQLDLFETLDLTLSEPLAIQPSLAWGRDGALGMAWCGMTEDNLGIWFGLWSHEGAVLSEPYILATATEGLQNEPATCALAGGGYAVAWSVDSQQQPTNLQVRFRIVGEDGQPVLAEDVRIGTGTQGNHWLAEIACSPNGGFTVVGTASELNNTFGVFAQHFNADGSPASEKTILNTVSEGNQVYPVAATDAAGRTLVVWEEQEVGDSLAALSGRWIDSAARPLTDVFQISADGVSVATPAVSINDETGEATVIGVQNQRQLIAYSIEQGAQVAREVFTPEGGITYNGRLDDAGRSGRFLLYLSGTGQNVGVQLGLLGIENTFEDEISLDAAPLPPYTPSVDFSAGRLAVAWTRRGLEHSYFLRLSIWSDPEDTP